MPVEFSVVASLVAVVALLAVSAFFSSTEIALFSLTPERLDTLAASDARGPGLQRLREDPHRLLVTILVGNNVVNMAIASITTALLVDVLPTGSAVTIATVVASFIVLVFGEIVPKSYGLGHAREWCLQVARPISIVERVLYPLVALFDFITRRINAVLNGDTAIEKPYLEE